MAVLVPNVRGSEGHGFGKKANKDTVTMATLLFLERHLGAPENTPGGSRP